MTSIALPNLLRALADVIEEDDASRPEQSGFEQRPEPSDYPHAIEIDLGDALPSGGGHRVIVLYAHVHRNGLWLHTVGGVESPLGTELQQPTLHTADAGGLVLASFVLDASGIISTRTGEWLREKVA